MNTLQKTPPPHLERLQKLFIKLLFCEPTRAAYCQSPQTVLSQYDLSSDYQRSLPDPNSEKFKVEAHGRRMRIFKETFGQFPQTIEMLDKSLEDSDGTGQGPDFNAFLSSDAFTDPGWALPAPDGSGPGYESISKFFFWIRDVCGLTGMNAPSQLRLTVYAEFAVHLINLSKTPCVPFYQKFSNGVMWCETPGESPPWFVVTDQLQLGKIGSASDFEPYSNWPDLDAVTPTGAPTEPNIQ
jgi:hypothetical protein